MAINENKIWGEKCFTWPRGIGNLNRVTGQFECGWRLFLGKNVYVACRVGERDQLW